MLGGVIRGGFVRIAPVLCKIALGALGGLVEDASGANSLFFWIL